MAVQGDERGVMKKQRLMSVVFRVDASLDIGTGHVMRCLTLAEALSGRGASCRFVCRAHPGNLIEMIQQHGFDVHALPLGPDWKPREATPAHVAWLGADWQTDAKQTEVCVGETAIDWLIVDHYALDARWEEALHGCYKNLMVIDDLADRPHACDLLLDQNLGREPVDYEAFVPARCQRLIGPQYSLLRPEFAALRAYSLQRRQAPALKRLLINMGGIDQLNATGKVLEALKTNPLPADCKITVLMGARAPWIEQVRAFAATMSWPIEVRVNVSDMAHVMADSDLAIGAAGSTSWERCCLGVPTLLVVLAENQLEGARALDHAGAVRLLGSPEAIPYELASFLPMLVRGQYLADMCCAAREVTDGQGTVRVLRQMESGA